MSQPSIGRLERVDVRLVWALEATDLTPWLLANADVLSDVLGMDLELERAEHVVGEFSLDLIGTNRADGSRVIVENQLGDSDHRHLGQLMTYAGGTDPAHVVWLASRFRDEHRAALEWLNDRTDEQTRFFAVQLEAVRIGDSAPGPLLTLVVQPNDWGKRVRASSDAQVRRWTREDLVGELAEVSPALAEKVADLLDRHLGLGDGASLSWGTGRKPSVTAVMTNSGLTLQPWTVSSDWATGGRPSWDLNLDWIHKSGRGLPADSLDELVKRLSGLPGVAERCADAPSAGWKRRPSLPAELVLMSPNAVVSISEAMACLYGRLNELDGGTSP